MDMLSALRRAGRGLRAAPRTLAAPFIQRTPLMVPGQVPETPYSGEEELDLVQVAPGIFLPRYMVEGGAAPPPPEGPRVPSGREVVRPSRLTRALPRALGAGIEAAATPNIVAPGGLPVPGGASIMRALQQARDYGQQQDILGYNLQRQGEQDRRETTRVEAEAERDRAQAEALRAQVGARETLKPIVTSTGAVLSPDGKTTLYEPMRTEAPPATLEALLARMIRDGADPAVIEAVKSLTTEIHPPAQPRPVAAPKPFTSWREDEKGNVNLLSFEPTTGAKTVTPFGGVGKPRPPTGGITPSRAETIERRKNLALDQLHNRTNAALRGRTVGGVLTRPSAEEKRRLIEDEADQAQQIQERYETSIENLTRQAVEPFDMRAFVLEKRKGQSSDLFGGGTAAPVRAGTAATPTPQDRLGIR